MAGLELVTAPSIEPVDLSSVKSHLRISESDTEENTLINSYIKAARSYAEEFMNRAIIEQTWKLYLDKLTHRISMPKPKLISIESFKLIDEDGEEIVVDSSNYLVNSAKFKGEIIFKKDSFATYNSYNLQEVNGVEIVFKAGYGISANDVPAHIIQGLLLLIGHMYENREDTTAVSLVKIPVGSKTLLSIDRVVSL